jgi:hypothetical protein
MRNKRKKERKKETREMLIRNDSKHIQEKEERKKRLAVEESLKL